MSPEKSLEITRHNYRHVDVLDLAKNPSIGKLSFPESGKSLKALQEWFGQFEDFGYVMNNKIPRVVKDEIGTGIGQLVELMNELRLYDISKRDAVERRKNLARRISSFYKQTYNSLIVTHLALLRQEALMQQVNTKDLTSVDSLKRGYDNAIEELKKQIDTIQKEKEDIKSGKGEIAAVSFGRHFENEEASLKAEVSKWGKVRSAFFWTLFSVVMINVIFYILVCLSILPKGWDFFTIEYSVVKLAFLLLLSYGIRFSSKQYTSNVHMLAVVRHRKVVAETLSDLLAADPSVEDRSTLVRKAAEAMFGHIATGVIKEGRGYANEQGPYDVVVNNVLSEGWKDDRI